MTQQEKNLLLITGIVGIGGGVGYWLYLYLQDPTNAPSLTDLAESLKSYFTRSYSIASGAVMDATGTSTYLDKATALLAKLEGFSPTVYNDQGHQAIGYGHDIVAGDPYDANSHISESEAQALLKIDLVSRDQCITDSVQVSLSDTQRAALLSFVYNVGCHAFQSSTMLRVLNSGDYQAAADEFQRWIYGTDPSTGTKVVLPVLESRRQTEMDTFSA